MSDLKFFKCTSNESDFYVKAEHVKINNIDCFVFEQDEGWNVSHVYTGMNIHHSASSRNTALLFAKEKMDKFPDQIQEGIEKAKKIGIILPANDLEKLK